MWSVRLSMRDRKAAEKELPGIRLLRLSSSENGDDPIQVDLLDVPLAGLYERNPSHRLSYEAIS